MHVHVHVVNIHVHIDIHANKCIEAISVQFINVPYIIQEVLIGGVHCTCIWLVQPPLLSPPLLVCPPSTTSILQAGEGAEGVQGQQLPPLLPERGPQLACVQLVRPTELHPRGRDGSREDCAVHRFPNRSLCESPIYM